MPCMRKWRATQRSMIEHITKEALYISAGTIIAMGVNNCHLTPKIIESCRSACRGTFSYMEEVSPRKCICTSDADPEWVLPR